MAIDFSRLMLAILTMALGVSIAASPERSARIWGRKQLEALTSVSRKWYLRAFRILGVLLCSAGVLVGLQSLWLRS
jgi:hypothetical protein